MFAGETSIGEGLRMEYRVLPRTGQRISIIGMGAGSLHNAGSDIERTVDAAIDAGMNLFDFVPSKAEMFEPAARALSRHRADVNIQVHIGACYDSGDYGWTTDAKKATPEFEQRLKTLGTDYADFGFIHCIDEDSDLDHVMNGGIWDYAQKRKQDGIIRHLAFSTHSANIARRLLKTDEFDLAMFSINPMYDFTDESDWGKGDTGDRALLYREFAQAGVGVSVMKAFAGGQLLDATASPFGIAFTQKQCVQYALDRPGVVSVLPGIRNMDDLRTALDYLEATPEERDYSALGKLTLRTDQSACIYCNHCQPCPEGIEIGLANRYYDLARLGDELAADHYRTMDKHASDCVKCGHCDSRCPFDVAQSNRMSEIADWFGI